MDARQNVARNNDKREPRSPVDLGLNLLKCPQPPFAAVAPTHGPANIPTTRRNNRAVATRHGTRSQARQRMHGGASRALPQQGPASDAAPTNASACPIAIIARCPSALSGISGFVAAVRPGTETVRVLPDSEANGIRQGREHRLRQ